MEIVVTILVVCIIGVLWDKLLGRKKTGFSWSLFRVGSNDDNSSFRKAIAEIRRNPSIVPPEQRPTPPPLFVPPDQPGRFRVIGVDRASGYDTHIDVSADSEANAKVKGELAGIVVTRIRRFKKTVASEDFSFD
jgi:hypothetical protein